MKYAIVFLCWTLVPLGVAVTASAQTRLIVAADDWAPYQFVAHDIVTGGFSTEVVRTVFEQMNIKIAGEIQAYPFARLESYILRGRIDAAFSLSSNEKRRQACYFPTESLVDSQWVLFIRKEDEGKITFTSWNDLNGKKISVVLAYAYPPEFLKFLETEQNFETVIHDKQGFQMLNARRVDFVAAEYGNALALLEELKLSDQILPLLDHPISTMKLYIAFNKQTVRQQLVDNFSVTLKIFKTTPAYEQLYKKYFER